MIYIKTFIKAFYNTIKWFFDPSTIFGLICNFIFYISIAVILLAESNILLAIGFITGSLNGIFSYLFNNRKRNFIWLILGSINIFITLSILITYLVIYII